MTKGIHHITAIASDAIETVHFYTKILGLRLVKKTVNQDDPETYHLFFGDRLGHPGMDLTFFIFLPAMQGKIGTGLVSKISLAVPESALQFWLERFQHYKVRHEEIEELCGKKRVSFFDKDGQCLELVGLSQDEFDSELDLWTAEVSEEHAIRNFYAATLSVVSIDAIEPVLTHVFGYKLHHTDGHIRQYVLSGSQRAQYLEVSEEPSAAPGFNAAGTVHHIAFRAKDAKQQQTMRNAVLELGLYPTEVINRFYFQSVYFRTPAGILFEIATDGPGFTADEDEVELGKQLSLPPFLQPHREEIEKHLKPIPGE